MHALFMTNAKTSALTINVTESAPREFRYLGTNGRRSYVQAGLIGTICETASIRVISKSATAKAPGNWSDAYPGDWGRFNAYCDREGLPTE